MEFIGSAVQARARKPFGHTPLSSVLSEKLRDAKQATMSLHRVDVSLARLPAEALQLCFCERRSTQRDVAKITTKRKTDVCVV